MTIFEKIREWGKDRGLIGAKRKGKIHDGVFVKDV
jgi:hypothetical protein